MIKAIRNLWRAAIGRQRASYPELGWPIPCVRCQNVYVMVKDRHRFDQAVCDDCLRRGINDG